jgi:chromosome partitioning protein
MILTIANQKGGVGKTTTAINLSAALAAKGLPTLLIDLDPQSNSSIAYLGIENLLQGPTIYEALTERDVPISSAIRPVEKVEGLSIAPSSITLAKIESKLLGDIDSHFRLKDKLDEVRAQYQYIVIDTPPTLGIITVNALVAATHVMIPIQSSYFALEGTDDLLETIDKIKMRANPQLQILGALVTLFDRRTILSRDIREQVAKVFGDKIFDVVITRSVRLEESPAHKESIFSFSPRSSGAFEYYKLSEEVLSRV